MGGAPFRGSIIFSGALDKPAYSGGVELRYDSDPTPIRLRLFYDTFWAISGALGRLRRFFRIQRAPWGLPEGTFGDEFCSRGTQKMDSGGPRAQP